MLQPESGSRADLDVEADGAKVLPPNPLASYTLNRNSTTSGRAR